MGPSELPSRPRTLLRPSDLLGSDLGHLGHASTDRGKKLDSTCRSIPPQAIGQRVPAVNVW
eukprot:6172139-Alexandrium_andersonii.AAC.1